MIEFFNHLLWRLFPESYIEVGSIWIVDFSAPEEWEKDERERILVVKVGNRKALIKVIDTNLELKTYNKKTITSCYKRIQ